MEDEDANDRECFVGAVKTNVGHLEAAAGIAGLIKVVLALEHEEIPANLHFKELNPYIDLDGSKLKISAAPQPWLRGEETRYAGVSSFGFGGTNAHVVLSDYTAASYPKTQVKTRQPAPRVNRRRSAQLTFWRCRPGASRRCRPLPNATARYWLSTKM